MADWFYRQDVQAFTAFTKLTIPFQSRAQSFFNDSANAAAVVEVSFDGVSVHGRLQQAGLTKSLSWDDHLISAVWVRYSGPAATCNFEIIAKS